MKLLGEFKGYQCFLNDDGFIEGYRLTHYEVVDKDTEKPTKIKRIVSNVTTVGEFIEFVTKKKKRNKSYDPYKDDNQLKIG